MISVLSCLTLIGLGISAFSYGIYVEDYFTSLVLTPVYLFFCTACVLLRRFHDIEELLDKLDYGCFHINSAIALATIYALYPFSILSIYKVLQLLSSLEIHEIENVITNLYFVIYLCVLIYLSLALPFTVFFCYDFIDRTTVFDYRPMNMNQYVKDFKIPKLVEANPAA